MHQLHRACPRTPGSQTLATEGISLYSISHRLFYGACTGFHPKIYFNLPDQ